MTDVEGERLRILAGAKVRLRIDSRRIPTTAEHIVATKMGDAPGRVVVFAHIDSRKGSPGALDNAAGAATLLALAELLSEASSAPSIEIVPLTRGQLRESRRDAVGRSERGSNGGHRPRLNIDDAGMRGEDTHVSFYGCPEPVVRAVRDAADVRDGITEGEQWFQSDHAIFGIYGRPAIALASADIAGFMAKYAHSERDTIDLVDQARLAEAARFLRDVLPGLSRLGSSPSAAGPVARP